MNIINENKDTTKKCLWCLKTEPEVTFLKKAHTIPKSLGGQNFNRNVCDTCNEYFGYRTNFCSIEEALKETFIISRQRILLSTKQKRQVGNFKSRFFDVKERKGANRIAYKDSFKFNDSFQRNLCRKFKQGLYKMYFEELNRQKSIGYEEDFDVIRKFARYDEGNLPVFYFNRLLPAIIMNEQEAATPVLIFDRMNYLYNDKFFSEIEFLGHVFGLTISDFGDNELQNYLRKTEKLKDKFFKNMVIVERLIDIDFTLSIFEK